MTPQEIANLRIGNVVSELPNGAACSPICFGHTYVVIDIGDEEITLLAMIDNEADGTFKNSIHTTTRKKSHLNWMTLVPPDVISGLWHYKR